MCNKIKVNHESEPCVPSKIRILHEKSPPTEVIEQDILAISTKFMKLGFNYVRGVFEKVKTTKFYSVVAETTQFAHVVVMLIALFLAATLQSSDESEKTPNVFCKFVYTASTAAHFGSQIWMTFVSGLSLYFSLPRHYFGEVQKILFPLYFTITSILSFATLLTYMPFVRNVETTVVLTACFFFEFLTRLYLCNPLVRLICIKNEMEAKHGLGMEIGKLSYDSELFNSQEYVAIHKRFRRLHMFIAMSNIACIGFSTAHLYLSVSNNQSIL